MKKWLLPLLFGFANLSVAANYDLSHLDEMSMYELSQQSSLGELLVKEIEKQKNAKMHPRLRSRLINDLKINLDEPLKQLIASVCEKEKEKCSRSFKSLGKPVFSKTREMFSETLEKAEQALKEEGLQLWISFKEYKNMTLAQLNSLELDSLTKDIYPLAESEYGPVNATVILSLLTKPEISGCNMKIYTPNQRKKANCDMKLKEFLNQL